MYNIKYRPEFCLLIRTLLFITILYAYWSEIVLEGAGVDILWRITESKYFLDGINPFDVFIGKKEVNIDYGKPAAYSFFSYFFAIPFIFIKNKVVVLAVYSIIDIFSFYASIRIIKYFFKSDSIVVEALTIIIALISMIQLGHIVCLNYGIISTFGLLLTLYGIERRKKFDILIGIFLLSLKPSLVIPLAIYFLISKRYKLLFSLILINFISILIVSIQVDTPPFELAQQLKQTQNYFANNGFYRWEGILLIFKNYIGDKITVVGMILTAIFIFIYKEKIKSNPINIFISVLTLSVSLYYNQEHSWSMAFPILGYCLYLLVEKDRYIMLFPLLLVVSFMVLPSGYIRYESAGFPNYMDYHNLVRFILLIFSSVWIMIEGNKISINN